MVQNGSWRSSCHIQIPRSEIKEKERRGMFKETYYQYKTIFHLQFTARRLQKVVFSGREQRASLRIQVCYAWGRREWVGQLAVSATVSIAFPEIQLSSDHSQVRKGFIHYNIKTPDLHPIISHPHTYWRVQWGSRLCCLTPTPLTRASTCPCTAVQWQSWRGKRESPESSNFTGTL